MLRRYHLVAAAMIGAPLSAWEMAELDEQDGEHLVEAVARITAPARRE